MSEQDGIIKFQLDYTQADPLPLEQVAELNAWRKLMYELQLIGQSPYRYAGYGFGNISRRIPPFDGTDQPRFIITGTQSGFFRNLTVNHYTTVLECYPEQNRLTGVGPVKPSAESMTHGTVYALDDTVRGVIHVHSPNIWRLTDRLGLPETSPDATYGSPEISAEVVRLFAETSVKEMGIFSMGGHEDGLVVFGPSVADAVAVLIAMLARAFQLEATA